MLDKFIKLLIVNNNDERDYGLALKTTMHRETFYVYKNNNNEIIVQPKKGKGQIPLPKKAIEKYLVDNNNNPKNNDLAYVVPICEYINKNMKG